MWEEPESEHWFHFIQLSVTQPGQERSPQINVVCVGSFVLFPHHLKQTHMSEVKAESEKKIKNIRYAYILDSSEDEKPSELKLCTPLSLQRGAVSVSSSEMGSGSIGGGQPERQHTHVREVQRHTALTKEKPRGPHSLKETDGISDGLTAEPSTE